MSKIIEKLYFFTKLSSSIILFLIIIFLIFLFSKAYLKQQNSSEEDYVKQINEISGEINLKLDENNNSIHNIIDKINKIENELKLLKETNKKNNNENLIKNIDKLYKDLNNLKVESQETIIKSQNDILFDEKKFLINKYIESILFRIEKGQEFGSIVIELKKLIKNNSFGVYLEKLLLLSDSNIPSYIDLKNNFDLISDKFLKQYLIDRSGNSIFVRFFLKFFNLKPDKKSETEDIIIKKLSIAKVYLYEKDLDLTIKELSKINYKTNYFEKWIKDAENYKESIKLIGLIKKDIENL